MKMIALDIETTGLNPRTDRIHGVGLYDGKNEAYYNAKVGSQWQTLAIVLSDPKRHIVGHNIRFDLKFLKQAGFEINCQVWDTKILAQLIDENQELGLKALTRKYLGGSNLAEKSELDRIISKHKMKSVADLCEATFDDTMMHLKYSNLIANYCIEDCKNTLALWNLLGKKLKHIDAEATKLGLSKTPLNYYLDEAMPLERALLTMEMRGIRLNVAGVKGYQAELIKENDHYMNQLNELCQTEIADIEVHFYNAAVNKRISAEGKANVKKRSERYKTIFNWQSPVHLSILLFRELGLPLSAVGTTSTGKPSTSEASLAQVCQRLPKGKTLRCTLEIYASWKKNLKLLNTYTGGKRGLLSKVEGGRVYAEYLQSGRGKEGTKGGTVTGRLSSRNPNMMNLPRNSRIKSFFLPDPGHVFIYFDYSQVELRIAAHLSRDPMLIKAYNEGQDLHQITADSLGVSRQLGKTINFAMIYDASPYRLAQILSKTPAECNLIIRDFYDLYSGYETSLARQKAFMTKYGFTYSEAGRIRRLPLLRGKPSAHTPGVTPREWNHAIKQGYNFPVQSLGATFTKLVMIALQKRGYDLVTQVYDSLALQVPKTADLQAEIIAIQKIAECIYKLRVPLKVDIKILNSLLESDIYNPNEGAQDVKSDS